MPVKNKARPTQSGFEGEIVALTNEEAKLISKAIQAGTGTTGKTIALFGDKSILVPSTVTETNYDIYCHMIHIVGSPTVSDFDIYFEFYSSKNLECNSLQDLKTVLGTTFTRSCNGIAKTKQAYAITELKVLTMSGEELLTDVTIEDTVKTI